MLNAEEQDFLQRVLRARRDPAKASMRYAAAVKKKTTTANMIDHIEKNVRKGNLQDDVLMRREKYVSQEIQRCDSNIKEARRDHGAAIVSARKEAQYQRKTFEKQKKRLEDFRKSNHVHTLRHIHEYRKTMIDFDGVAKEVEILEEVQKIANKLQREPIADEGSLKEKKLLRDNVLRQYLEGKRNARWVVYPRSPLLYHHHHY